ncbi:hypothetical protein AG1IA_00019 [Rhizoctonia solani AG-1 IA]|uniref:Uncharacterized protein n=1 Tax=Thanatephorus cucumeris (strain AG1-IA) TaxID=983506 RepID=L8XB90_THACA|nr:hypothetical protein AG1IA_00019 [Rhizoctonia solani AG-1 IA]
MVREIVRNKGSIQLGKPSTRVRQIISSRSTRPVGQRRPYDREPVVDFGRAPERDEAHGSGASYGLTNAPLRTPCQAGLGPRVDLTHVGDEGLEQQRILEFVQGVDGEFAESIDGLGVCSRGAHCLLFAPCVGLCDAVLPGELVGAYKLGECTSVSCVHRVDTLGKRWCTWFGCISFGFSNRVAGRAAPSK